MQTRVETTLENIAPDAWNALVGDDLFSSHEFLIALEHNGCVGEEFGWLPHYVCLYDDDTLVAATILYLKDNSYGEFVFDHGWADAYHRHGIPYYPKLVSSIPYTPATGARLLLSPNVSNREQTAKQLIDDSLQLMRELDASSLHFQFPPEAEMSMYTAQDLIPRLGTQYHWTNRDYKDFDDFLAQLSHGKRKNIRRERRRVEEAFIKTRVVHGDEATADDIRLAEHFYRVTYDRKWGYPVFNTGFFTEACKTMGDKVLFVFADRHDETIAGAICYRNESTLYGRHWGTDCYWDSLHFELCYYQGIEYCINNGLQTFEPGAQGEHKIPRGFLPVQTWSAHWIEHPQFREVLQRHLRRETEDMKLVIEELMERSPYKQ